MIQRIKQEKNINIFDLVKQLRSQRTKSVQTLDQYVFLYTSAVELTESRKQQPQGEINKKSHVGKYSFSVHFHSLTEPNSLHKRFEAIQAIEDGSERKQKR